METSAGRRGKPMNKDPRTGDGSIGTGWPSSQVAATMIHLRLAASISIRLADSNRPMESIIDDLNAKWD